jgi:tRNA dimethylallyltransferase
MTTTHTHASGDSPVVMLAGPTGVGKTAVAVRLAERHGLEVLSADSMQVYRGMAIGTAQPTDEQRARVAFHVCGSVDPAEPFNAHRFVELCDAAHRDILARGRRPLYVGGTGLYLRALRWGLSPRTGRDTAIRQRLEGEVSELGSAALHDRLRQVDPVAAARIAPADAIRIVRALEVLEATGRPISEHQIEWPDPAARFPHVLVVLDADREALDRRIGARAAAMLRDGWIEETRALLARGLPPGQHCFKALGYRRIIDHLEGRIDRAELERLIVLRTRQFARRQRTWFRRERPATWIAVDDNGAGNPPAALEKLVEKP